MSKGFYSLLAESLEEKHQLNEAWGNAPSWLKKSLSKVAYSRHSDYHLTDRDRATKLYKKLMQENPNNSIAYIDSLYRREKGDTLGRDFKSPNRNSSDYGLSNSDKNIIGAAQRLGIDLTKCSYVEMEAPTNPRDPIVQPPNIPIWSLPTKDDNVNQVYARGINDYEKGSWSLLSSNLADKTFEGLSVKALAAACNHFCYIPGDEIVHTDFYKKSAERKDFKNFDVINGRGKPGEQAYTPVGGGNYGERDKSGYIVVPSAKKYAKELKMIGLKSAADTLVKLHDEIYGMVGAFRSYMNSLSDNEFLSNGNWAINNISSTLNSLARELERLYDLVDRSQNQPNPAEMLTDYRFMDKMKDLQTSINRAKKAYDEYLSAEVDF